MKTVLNGLVNSVITKIDNGFVRPQKEMTTTIIPLHSILSMFFSNGFYTHTFIQDTVEV